jgi:hypothetical protein
MILNPLLLEHLLNHYELKHSSVVFFGGKRLTKCHFSGNQLFSPSRSASQRTHPDDDKCRQIVSSSFATRLNQEVLLTGYGQDGDTEHWIVKNFWDSHGLSTDASGCAATRAISAASPPKPSSRSRSSFKPVAWDLGRIASPVRSVGRLNILIILIGAAVLRNSFSSVSLLLGLAVLDDAEALRLYSNY